MRWLVLCFAALLLGAGSFGCSPSIGDSCTTSTDCSIDGQRICDRAQPDGYCTVEGCDPDTCPDGALCVEFRFRPPRTAETWCMKKCGSDGGCRQGDGYRCLRPDDPELEAHDGEPIARIVDHAEKRRKKGFCAVPGLPMGS